MNFATCQAGRIPKAWGTPGRIIQTLTAHST